MTNTKLNTCPNCGVGACFYCTSEQAAKRYRVEYRLGTAPWRIYNTTELLEAARAMRASFYDSAARCGNPEPQMRVLDTTTEPPTEVL